MSESNPERRQFMADMARLTATSVLAGCATTAADSGRAAAAATHRAKPAPQRRAIGPNDRIQCAFIGVGSRGSSILESTLTLEGVDVTAVCDTYDVWRDRAVNWCKAKRPEVGSYVRFEDMFEKEPLDAVVIATPDHIHTPAVLAALDAGLDVYCEKPIALTAQDARDIRDWVGETGAVFQTGTQLRSMPMYQKAREVVGSGAIGKLVLVQVNRHFKSGRLTEAAPPGDANEENVHWAAFLRDTKSYPLDFTRYFHWRQFREYSNGYFGDLMLHHLDMCHFITGSDMPARVVAAGGIYNVEDGRSTPDTVSAVVEYPDSKFHFNFTTADSNGHFGLVERYLGTEGTLEITGMGAMSVFRNDVEEKVPSDGIRNEPHLQNFFDAMRNRSTTIAPAEAGCMGATVAHMAVWSLDSGRAVRWDAEAGAPVLA
ncbi:MAG: Gfo/Idh/MocA family oxidoreductase [Candidatus Hydrogenedentes bacterium]|nr:Gfo/Idh/MocA family oxidoreductase [Candidatus Hydrogenedentota bacterium]